MVSRSSSATSPPTCPKKCGTASAMPGKLEEWCDRATGDWEVNKVTYKTPDYMLCSAQDYHPGESGVAAAHLAGHPRTRCGRLCHASALPERRELAPARLLAWQCRSAARRAVERCAHRHSQIAGRRLAGFHARVFSRLGVRRACVAPVRRARMVGSGHLRARATATWRSRRRVGWNSSRRATMPTANCARTVQNNVWLCHMGRAALDGDFSPFQDKILALDVSFDELVRALHHLARRDAGLWLGRAADAKRSARSACRIQAL